MRFIFFLLAFWLLLMIAPSNASAPPAGGPYDAQWKKIDALLDKDQTESARKLVLDIYQKARAAKQAPDYVRALIYRLHLLEQKEEDAEEKGIQLLEADLAAAPFPARALLHSLLAEHYHQYLQQNRYRLYDRTTVGKPAPEEASDLVNDPDGGDIATWDAARLAAQVLRHYRASVETDAGQLQKTRLPELGHLATLADAPGNALRPTLYDLLVHRAIEGLGDDELSLTKPAEQFRFTDPKLFGADAEFLALPLTAPAADSLNGPLQALRLWQQLTRFHQGADAALRADLERLRLAFVYRHAPAATARTSYEAALRRAQRQYEQLPAWADFQVELAQLAQQRGEPAEAVKLAQEAIRRYPKSVGAARAQQLLNDLERPVLNAQTQQVQLPGQALLLNVQYRNLSVAHGFAWKISAEAMRRETLNRRNYEPAKTYAKLLATKPAAQWNMALPGSTDYRLHRAELAGPALPAGHYLVVVSTAAERPTKDQPTISTDYVFLSVSELGSVQRAATAAAGADLWALNRRTGQPVAGVAVRTWYQDYRNNKFTAGPEQTTDAAGHALVPPQNDQLGYMRALQLSKGRDTLILTENLRYYQQPINVEPQEQRHAFLYTDRAIYRPGQKLYFKGIVAREQNGRSEVLKNLPVSLELHDVNGQQVLELPFTTSEYGSFHGELTLPAGLLNGEMRLLVRSKAAGRDEVLGNQGFSVEDYKRPTFFVTLDPVKGTPRLGDTLSVRGTATAYAGPAVDGATVQYRVVRRTVWPLFGWAALDFGFGGETSGGGRGYYPGGGAEQQITTGTAKTDAQGHFRVSFTATAPDDAPADDNDGNDDEEGGYWPPRHSRPIYVFDVTADVVDPNGETRSAQRSVNLGGAPLNLLLTGPKEVSQQQPTPAFGLRSQNATGETVPATGTLRLYQLTPPDRVLHPRFGPQPDQPGLPQAEHRKLFPHEPWLRETSPDTWPKRLVGEWAFDTNKSTALPEMVQALAAQAPGAYLLEARSVLGTDTAQARLGFTLYNPTAKRLPLPLPLWLTSANDSVAPGQAAQVLVGSGFENAPVRLEVESRGQLLRAEWLTLQNEQRLISLPAAPAGPLYVRLVLVQDGRFYQRELTIMVAEPPRPLALDISTFRDKLQPGEKETWRVTIKNSQNQPAAAELLTTLYDQSLDYFRPHRFEQPELSAPYFGPRFGWSGQFGTVRWQTLLYSFAGKPSGQAYYLYPGLRLDYWEWHELEKRSTVKFTPPVIKADEEVHASFGRADDKVMSRNRMAAGGAPGAPMMAAAPAPMMAKKASVAPSVAMADSNKELNEEVKVGYGTPKPAADLSAVPVRTDFRETAMWQPAVRTNAQGEVVLEFQMPEAVTRWQLLALAHTPDLQTGLLARQLVTQKQLMVTPNAPRFFREGDQLRLTAKISNLAASSLSGTAQLQLLDARTNQPLDAQLLKSPAQVTFDVAAAQSTTVGWELSILADQAVPLEAVTYRVVASGQMSKADAKAGKKAKKKDKKAKNDQQSTTNNQQSTFSDGEENTLPVLPNRLLVTEALPLALTGAGTRTFELQKLTSTTSATRRNQSLTLELTANPAWYAVQSLPYLMEYPYECAEQTFSRLYANLLAARIVQANPLIRPMLAEWKKAAASGDKNALRSKLEQNQELKNLLLQETPWVRDGQTDTERMRRLADLFDEQKLQAETQRAIQRLQEMQSPSGAFPWFKQMPDNRYITQLIVAGFGRLRQLEAFDAMADTRTADMLTQAVAYLDRELQDDYATLRRQKNVKLTDDHLGDSELQALYARSFWLQDSDPTLRAAAKPAYDYYRGQAAQYWPKRGRYLQGMAALVLHRSAQAKAAQPVIEALRQNALHSPELGMYWKDVQAGFYWQQAPVETQSLLIEAFHEAGKDDKSVEEMKLWLLSHKRTHNWESTRATADACYALLLQGSRNWLTPAQPLQVTLGTTKINTTEGAEAGTGYVKRSFPAAEVRADMGKVTVQKTDAGVAWGGLYWQYFEQLDKITVAANAPLTLTRQLFRETTGASGPVLTPMTEGAPLRVGEVLVVRLTLKTDRELEYVHLKDTRAAGLELIGQTSGYRYQQGLGYYESPRDAATNFFLDFVPRGAHIFEYRLRAAQAGDFSSGISQVQCMYAPEFTSHSAGQRLRIGAQ